MVSDDKGCIKRLVKEDRKTEKGSFCLNGLGNGAPTAMSHISFHLWKIQNSDLRQPRTAKDQGLFKLNTSISSKTPNDGIA